jgi:hypothetical protein
MADIDYDKLGTAVAKAIAARGSSGGGFSAQPAKPVDFSLNPLKNTAEAAKTALTELKDAAKNSLGTFRDLARNGATFSNDLLGMGMAAANSRMSLEEFSDVISKNGKNLSGLGVGVSKGAEAFANFSKGFFDSKMSDQLRSLAFTTKEMNEVMAIHMGNVRSSAALDDEGRKKEYEAAAKLAKEMDATSKLMGKNREIQMEEAKARQADMQVQAKIRSESQKMRAEGKSEDEISAYKSNVMAALKKAEDQGAGQAAKEMFATGTVTSQTGAMQASMQQGQVSAIGDELKAARRGDKEGIEAARAKATSEAVKNQNDPAILSVMALGDAAGDLAGPLRDAGKAMLTFQDSLERIARTEKLDLTKAGDREKAIKIAEAEAKKVPDPKKTGVTEGALAVEKVGQEIKAGAAQAADAIGKGGESLADQLRKTGLVIAETVRGIEGPGRGLGKLIGDKSAAGLKSEPVEKRPGEGSAAFEKRQSEASGGALGTVMQGAFKTSEMLLGEVNKGIKEVGDLLKDSKSSSPATQVPKRNEGSLGSVGKLFEDFGQGTLVELHGMESVMKPEDLENLVQNSVGGLGKGLSKLKPPAEEKSGSSFAESMAASVRKGMQTVGVDPNMRGNPTGGMDGFDLSSISKDISTTISSVTGGGSSTTQRTQSDDSKAAEKELKSVKEQYAVEREALLQKTKEQLGPDAGSRKIRTEMRDGEEGKALEEKYKALIGPLEKQIEDGIKWEVETKQVAVEETKKIMESELLTKEDQATALERINENRKKINTDETKSISEQLSVYKQSNEAKTEEEKNTAAALERINENRKKINTDEIKASTSPGPIIKQDQINKSIENPLLNDKGKISLNKLNLPGMPNFGSAAAPKDPKSAAPKNAADSISEDAKKAEEKKKIEDAKKAEAAKGTTPSKPTGSVQQTASLNDVVKSLDQLNMQMGKLISQQSDLIRKQTSSMLAAGSNNVYDKTR